jgi:hypothetical protein
METYLQYYMNYKQNNWVGLFLLAQFAYNTFVIENTKILPVYAIYRYIPKTYRLVVILEVDN